MGLLKKTTIVKAASSMTEICNIEKDMVIFEKTDKPSSSRIGYLLSQKFKRKYQVKYFQVPINKKNCKISKKKTVEKQS